ncbi:MAG: 2-amino-4-hydroxy-6-hydroxymethyldihydropteridine diphosphokinase [Parachlamydia sp.]|nr:2-amino-4-hydroxy-6-hydroxymethyldihydropteridine diphosphokinase [Parachlamydia sp.]
MLPDVYVGLGSNLGDPGALVAEALGLLEALPILSEFEASPFYLTSPVSDLPQPHFINAVCRFKTTLSPLKLFAELQKIERHLGQTPKPKNAPRLIDLDILFFGKERLLTSELEIPHPRWKERLFVLRPLADLTSYVPGTDVPIQDLLFHPSLVGQEVNLLKKEVFV